MYVGVASAVFRISSQIVIRMEQNTAKGLRVLHWENVVRVVVLAVNSVKVLVLAPLMYVKYAMEMAKVRVGVVPRHHKIALAFATFPGKDPLISGVVAINLVQTHVAVVHNEQAVIIRVEVQRW